MYLYVENLNNAFLHQVLGTDVPSETAPLPFNFYNGDNSNFIQESTDFKDDAQELLVGTGENHCDPDQPDDQNLFDLPVQHDITAKSVKHEYIGEPSNNSNAVDVDYLLDESFVDAIGNFPFDDGAFLEANDLTNPVEADPSGFDMLEEYLTFFDADGDNLQYMNFYSSMMKGGEDLVSDPASLSNEVILYLNLTIDFGFC